MKTLSPERSLYTIRPEAKFSINAIRARASGLRTAWHANRHSVRGRHASTLAVRSVVPRDNVLENRTQDGNAIPAIVHGSLYYSQHDARWAKTTYALPYMRQTIGESGCVPTSMAMVLSNITGREILPPELCEYSVENDFRTEDSGTKHSFIHALCREYNMQHKKLSQRNIWKSASLISQRLDNGAFLIVSARGNAPDLPLSPRGHAFLITRIFPDATCLILDPNSVENSISTYQIADLLPYITTSSLIMSKMKK